MVMRLKDHGGHEGSAAAEDQPTIGDLLASIEELKVQLAPVCELASIFLNQQKEVERYRAEQRETGLFAKAASDDHKTGEGASGSAAVADTQKSDGHGDGNSSDGPNS